MLLKKNIQNIFRLSPAQEGLYFHYLAGDKPSAYIEQLSYRIHGLLDVGIAKASWEYLFSRHEVLRTVFNHKKMDIPLQVVLKEREVDLCYHDISHEPDAHVKEALIQDFKKVDRSRPFNLNEDVLV
ncbi:condensation domain-containing protein, partial [Flavitalea sp. BT771]|uniref:condensation domain-containing protein n=1 Tax=Flavitalea sp. BT771 TaxID=3063329 RepID=UPI0026E36F06